MKYFLDPPPQKKRLKDTNGRDMATRTCVCVYKQPMTWTFTWPRLSDLAQSNPFINNCFLIIVAFSRQYFSIHIFYTK